MQKQPHKSPPTLKPSPPEQVLKFNMYIDITGWLDNLFWKITVLCLQITDLETNFTGTQKQRVKKSFKVQINVSEIVNGISIIGIVIYSIVLQTIFPRI